MGENREGSACGGRLPLARLVEEPRPLLGLVDPLLDQAGRRDVAALLADAVRLAKARREPAVVLAQFGEHVVRIDEVRVVVLDALQTRNLADRLDRRPADLADPLGHRVRHGQQFRRLPVEEFVVLAEVRAGHVPVKVLRLQVQRKDVGERRVDHVRDLPHRLGRKVGGNGQRRGLTLPGVTHPGRGVGSHVRSRCARVRCRQDTCETLPASLSPV